MWRKMRLDGEEKWKEKGGWIKGMRGRTEGRRASCVSKKERNK